MTEHPYDILKDMYTVDENGEKVLYRGLSVGEFRRIIVPETADPDAIENADFRQLIRGMSRARDIILIEILEEERKHLKVVTRWEKDIPPVFESQMNSIDYERVASGVTSIEYINGETWPHSYAEFRPDG